MTWVVIKKDVVVGVDTWVWELLDNLVSNEIPVMISPTKPRIVNILVNNWNVELVNEIITGILGEEDVGRC